ncbi:hypothetical protein NKG05_07765 [Oerskovia sp. M15]
MSSRAVPRVWRPIATGCSRPRGRPARPRHRPRPARTLGPRAGRAGPADAGLADELARLFDDETAEQAAAQASAHGEGDPDAVESVLRTRLTSQVEEAQTRQGHLGTRIAAQMTAFRAAYPVETSELDNDVRSTPSTGRCTSASRATTCHGSRATSRRTSTPTRSATSPASTPSCPSRRTSSVSGSRSSTTRCARSTTTRAVHPPRDGAHAQHRGP